MLQSVRTDQRPRACTDKRKINRTDTAGPKGPALRCTSPRQRNRTDKRQFVRTDPNRDCTDMPQGLRTDPIKMHLALVTSHRVVRPVKAGHDSLALLGKAL